MKKVKIQTLAVNDNTGHDELIHNDHVVLGREYYYNKNLNNVYMIKIILRQEYIYVNMFYRNLWERLTGTRRVKTFRHNGFNWQRKDSLGTWIDSNLVKADWGLWEMEEHIEDVLEYAYGEDEFFDYIFPDKGKFTVFYSFPTSEEEDYSEFHGRDIDLTKTIHIPEGSTITMTSLTTSVPEEEGEERIEAWREEAAKADSGLMSHYVAPVVTHTTVDDTPSRSSNSSRSDNGGWSSSDSDSSSFSGGSD